MKRVKDRIAGSLSIKIFLLTAVLLILISLFTYFCIVKFLPVTYQNELEENLQKVSEELRAELERYRRSKRHRICWNFLPRTIRQA